MGNTSAADRNRIFVDATDCPICGRHANAPWRTYNDDKTIRFGCVDSFHTGHLVTPSNDSAFHDREEAKRIRRIIDTYRR